MEDKTESKVMDLVTFSYVTNETLKKSSASIEHQKAFQSIESELSNLNLNRGGGNTSGFVFEDMYAMDKNLSYLKNNECKVVNVINDNGVADVKITDLATGEETFGQAKMGYHGTNKYKVSPEKYDKQIIITDKTNQELGTYIERKGGTVEYSNVSEEQVKQMTDIMQKEGQVREKVGLSNTAPVTSKLYVLSNRLKSANAVGLNAAKSAAVLTAGISFAQNMYQYMDGTKEIEEVLIDTAKDTAKAAIKGYVVGVVGDLAAGAASSIIVGTGLAGTTVGAAFVAVGSVIATVSAVAVPVFLAGMAIGAGITVCSMFQKKQKQYKSEISRLNKELNETIYYLNRAYQELDEQIRLELNRLNQGFSNAFTTIQVGIKADSFELLSSGIDEIEKMMGHEVRFKNVDEFDEFFYKNETLVF